MDYAADAKHGKVLGCVTFGPAASPIPERNAGLFHYGIHAVEILYTLMGPGCERVTCAHEKDVDVVTGQWKDGRVATVRGIRAGGGSFGFTGVRREGAARRGRRDGGHLPRAAQEGRRDVQDREVPARHPGDARDRGVHRGGEQERGEPRGRGDGEGMTRWVWFVLAVLAAAPPAAAEDWPRWRGPRGDGTWTAPAHPRSGRPAAPGCLEAAVGGGYAGVTAAGGRVYTMDYQPAADRKSRNGASPLLRRRDRQAGLGTRLPGQLRRPRRVRQRPAGRRRPSTTASSTPSGRSATCSASTPRSGRVLWQHDTVKEYGARVPMWGFAGAPVIDDNRLIVHLGAEPNGCVMALDRTTGKEMWRSLKDEAGYCTPVVADTPSGRQLIVWTPENVHGLDPATGKPFWKVPYKVTYGVSIATPIVPRRASCS